MSVVYVVMQSVPTWDSTFRDSHYENVCVKAFYVKEEAKKYVTQNLTSGFYIEEVEAVL